MIRWLKREIPWPDDAVRTVAGLVAALGEVAWLDSSDASPGGAVNPPARARSSLICWNPSVVVSQTASETTVASRLGRNERASSIWDALKHSSSLNPAHADTGFGLSPGWIGFFGFPAAASLERVHCHIDEGEVVARLSLYDRGVVLDHATGRATAILSAGVPNGDAELDQLISEWTEAPRRSVAPPPPKTRIRETIRRTDFEAAVRRAKSYIAAGDIYQVNLAHRIRLDFDGVPLAAYRQLRSANPATYGAFLQWEDRAIASVSPELFLDVHDRRVRTSPIKGTRRLTGDPETDAACVRELLDSEKDAAELAMIVDLHRNDLGRVCRPGGVRVVDARRVERIPGVVHTVADIEGQLAQGLDALDALMACFPAGSISGVPKIRAIDIIAELESTPRGAYTGAIGVLGLDGSATFNVAIRTLQLTPRRADLHVGAGIVADSDPAAEYSETLTKARRILAALGIDAEDAPR